MQELQSKSRHTSEGKLKMKPRELRVEYSTVRKKATVKETTSTHQIIYIYCSPKLRDALVHLWRMTLLAYCIGVPIAVTYLYQENALNEAKLDELQTRLQIHLEAGFGKQQETKAKRVSKRSVNVNRSDLYTYNDTDEASAPDMHTFKPQRLALENSIARAEFIERYTTSLRVEHSVARKLEALSENIQAYENKMAATEAWLNATLAMMKKEYSQPCKCRGLPGLQGRPGVHGEKGYQGHAGTTGPKGSKGETGALGKNGLKGSKGDHGICDCSALDSGRGPPGRPGPPGLKGDKGDAITVPGSSGPKGESGPIGLPGRQGEKGDRGLKGEPATCMCEKELTMTSFVRWGSRFCPRQNLTTLVYSGLAASSLTSDRGGGSNYLCLPDEPTYMKYEAKPNAVAAQLDGVKYNPDSSVFHIAARDKAVVCASCLIAGFSASAMYPAKSQCPIDWTELYKGYLVTQSQSSRTEFICVDFHAEARDITGSRAVRTGTLDPVELGSCDILKCGQDEYLRHSHMACIVCAR